jgi:superfamily II DNA helicase RecQ
MKYKIWTIPCLSASQQLQKEFDTFILSHIIVDVEKKFFQTDSGGYWSFCVGYYDTGTLKVAQHIPANTGEKPDYQKILGEKYHIFEKYKNIRTQLSKEAGYPPYTIFNDYELSEIAKLESPNETNAAAIKGISKNKVGKYFKLLIERYDKLPKEEKTEEIKIEVKNEKNGLFDI